MTVLIYKRDSDGGLRIRRLIDQRTGQLRDATQDDAAPIPGYTFQGIAEHAELPARTKREAWTYSNRRVVIDPAKETAVTRSP
jgi:hypothetical protein